MSTKRLPSPRTPRRLPSPKPPAAAAAGGGGGGGGGLKLPPSMQAAFAKKELGEVPEVSLDELPAKLSDIVYVDGKWPFVIDVEGIAKQFLKYFNGSVMISVKNQAEWQRDHLRKTLVHAIKGGIPLVVDFADANTVEFDDYFDETYFPAEIFDKKRLLNKSTLTKLLRPDQGDPSEAEYAPSDEFMLVCLCSTDMPPKRTSEKMRIVKVKEKAAENAEDPMASMSTGLKPWVKMNEKLRIGAFEGDLDQVKKAYDDGANIESTDHDGYTALSEASVAGKKATVEFLLSKGANPNVKGGKDKRTPLFRAAFNGHADVCRILLEAGADPDAFQAKNFPEDVTKILSKWDRRETAKLKEKREAEKKQNAALADAAMTPEEKAKQEKEKIKALVCRLTKEGNMATLREYLDAGVPPEVTDETGNSLLALAAWEGHEDIVKALVETYSANVNARDSNGWSCVMVAAFHDRRRIVQYLLSKGANPLLRNKYRKSALDMAKGDETTKVLRAHIDGTQVDLTQTADEKAKVYAGPSTESMQTWKPTSL